MGEARNGVQMYPGVGTVVTILTIVAIICLLRRA